MALTDANDLHENGRPRKEVASSHFLGSHQEMDPSLNSKPVIFQEYSLPYTSLPDCLASWSCSLLL
jgi:hypothetical protein